MKSPHHEVPSGDRKMARALLALFESLGHSVSLISEYRSYEGSGNADKQNQIRKQGQIELNKIYAQSQLWLDSLDCIFTYHLYHKAPDWIGVELAEKLKIPYIIAEASFARKQKNGLWAEGHKQAAHCIRRARGIVSFNPNDVGGLELLLSADQFHQFIYPFLDGTQVCRQAKDELRSDIAASFDLDQSSTWLVCVAMMRTGDKLESYQALSQILLKTKQPNWRLLIVGDGEARQKVESLFGSNVKIVFTGELIQSEIAKILKASDIYIWPGINEAFGFALLEAVMHGLPALSYNYGGIPTIIRHNYNGLLFEAGDETGFAKGLDQLLLDENKRNQFGEYALHKFSENHDLAIARKHLKNLFEKVGLPS